MPWTQTELDALKRAGGRREEEVLRALRIHPGIEGGLRGEGKVTGDAHDDV